MYKLKSIFIYGFILLLVISFFIQYSVLKNLSISLSSSKLIEAYLINGLLVIIFFVIIKIFLQKIKTNLGFIFIAFSLLKFVLFFIFINPTYKLDNTTTIIEFTSFFTPYFMCLIIEVLFLSKLLNNLKF